MSPLPRHATTIDQRAALPLRQDYRGLGDVFPFLVLNDEETPTA
jgi:hypothetical protein